jgi:hypothetical protein
MHHTYTRAELPIYYIKQKNQVTCCADRVVESNNLDIYMELLLLLLLLLLFFHHPSPSG